jgi:hypothetical protein
MPLIRSGELSVGNLEECVEHGNPLNPVNGLSADDRRSAILPDHSVRLTPDDGRFGTLSWRPDLDPLVSERPNKSMNPLSGPSARRFVSAALERQWKMTVDESADPVSGVVVRITGWHENGRENELLRLCCLFWMNLLAFSSSAESSQITGWSVFPIQSFSVRWVIQLSHELHA